MATLVAGTAGTAHALKPGKHADIAYDSCKAAGLPGDFCQRTATEDYDTDSREWTDLRAHAQIDDAQTACQAADAAADRLWHLGDQLRTSLAAVAASGDRDNVAAAASALGRALHTIQDNCAHHGMPNPQHAWFSISDFCDGTELSPDIQPDAIQCAREQTDQVMAEVAAAIHQAGVAETLGDLACPAEPARSNETPVCQRRFLPGPIDACSFLARSHDWDGIDRTWNNAVVIPALRDAFVAGLTGQAEATSMCGGDESVLSAAVSAPIVDVSGGPASCVRATLFCLGKADDSDNPFADDPEPSAGGCAVGGGSGLELVLVIGWLALRRRRQHGAGSR